MDRVVSVNHSWHQKTRDIGLPDGEDRIPLRSLVLTEYRSVTDRQTDGCVVSYTALALRNAVKMRWTGAEVGSTVHTVT